MTTLDETAMCPPPRFNITALPPAGIAEVGQLHATGQRRGNDPPTLCTSQPWGDVTPGARIVGMVQDQANVVPASPNSCLTRLSSIALYTLRPLIRRTSWFCYACL